MFITSNKETEKKAPEFLKYLEDMSLQYYMHSTEDMPLQYYAYSTEVMLY